MAFLNSFPTKKNLSITQTKLIILKIFHFTGQRLNSCQVSMVHGHGGTVFWNLILHGVSHNKVSFSAIACSAMLLFIFPSFAYCVLQAQVTFPSLQDICWLDFSQMTAFMSPLHAWAISKRKKHHVPQFKYAYSLLVCRRHVRSRCFLVRCPHSKYKSPEGSWDWVWVQVLPIPLTSKLLILTCEGQNLIR